MNGENNGERMTKGEGECPYLEEAEGEPSPRGEKRRQCEGCQQEGRRRVSRSVHCRHSQTLADTCRLFEGFVRRAPEVSIFHM